MSKEKQCECCHEWWYGSDVKEDLCPNCYYYFKQLKRQLEEKDKEIEQYKSNQKVISLHSKEDWYNRFIDTTIQNIKLEFTQKQLAIQELEKVKEWLEPKYFDYEQINYLTRIINNQIKELKGE